MPETDDFPSGPAIGEPMPDFTLVNQRGESTNFATARSGKKALVVFHRSVRW
jgi:peroxiredoxin